MSLITLRQAAQWCGGRVAEKYADVAFLGANIDSRNIQPGQLFVALKAQRDGHDFIPMAMEKGAAAVLCSRECGDIPAILVEDTRIALGDIARGERQRLGMQVVGVTGSVGKSTTKEMIATVLEGAYRVEKTPVNHNNDLGMPMAILSMPADTQVAVLEMGMNHFREIAYLASIARPNIGVIINVGTMHIEHLGSRDGILKAKMEILEGLQEGGKLLLNGDNDKLWEQREHCPVKPCYFGMENPLSQIRGSALEEGDRLLRFRVEADDVSFPIELALEGTHYVSDALAAVSVGLAMGVQPEVITRQLAAFRNMEGRQEMLEAKGCSIIKDCYNAGPESMAAALVVLGKRKGRRVAVLGDMLELGANAQAEHYRVGRIAAENADVILAFGPNSDRVVSGALTGGMLPAKVQAFTDREQLITALKRTAKPGDVLLFKGSHGMHMELALEGFLQET